MTGIIKNNVERLIQGQQPQEDERLGPVSIFKFNKPTLGYDKVFIHNQDKSWTGYMLLNDALNQVFAGEHQFYVRGQPQMNGQLYILEFVDDQHWL